MSNTTGFTPPQGGASITDILTALKNVATAINGWTQQQQTLAGTSNSPNITGATLVKGGAGRLVGVSIVVQGSADGAIYDIGAASGAAASNKLYTVSHSAAVGYYPLGVTTSLGLVVVPGSGQTLMVTYA